MKWNLRSIEKFSFWGEIKVMFKTVFAVLGKDYEADAAGEAEFADKIQKEEYTEIM